MEAQRDIEELVAYRGRVAGSDAERRAANHLAQRLRDLGRGAEVEPIEIYPNYPLTHLIHALLAVAGSLATVASPLVGMLIVAFAFLSTLGDLTGTLFLVRRTTGRRASQNVTSKEHAARSGVLVLVAHYDAARGGLLFGHRMLRGRAGLAKRLRLPIGLGGAFVLAMLVVLACAVLRVLGVDSPAVSAIQFVPTALLVLSLALLADLQLSAVSPGAADNASGVATALRLARHYGRGLEHLDLWVLFTGAEEPMALGMRGWLRAHRAELPRDRAVFVNVDKVATGNPRYATREGLVVAASSDRELVRLCEEVADGGHVNADADGAPRAHPVVMRSTSDALAARAKGYPSITISCLSDIDHEPHQHQSTDTPDRVDPDALDRAYGFCAALVERIDETLGPQMSRAGDRE